MTNKFKQGEQVAGHSKGQPIAGAVWGIDGDKMVVAYTEVVGGKLSFRSDHVKVSDFKRV